MRVKIEAGGRTVEIECGDANVTYSALADTALRVWKAADGPSPTALGFAQATHERRADRILEPVAGGYLRPVNAQADQ